MVLQLTWVCGGGGLSQVQQLSDASRLVVQLVGATGDAAVPQAVEAGLMLLLAAELDYLFVAYTPGSHPLHPDRSSR